MASTTVNSSVSFEQIFRTFAIMARPKRSSKPSSQRKDDLAALTTEVLQLRLQAQNLPITGSQAQSIAALQSALRKRAQLLQAQQPLSQPVKPPGKFQSRQNHHCQVQNQNVPQAYTIRRWHQHARTLPTMNCLFLLYLTTRTPIQTLALLQGIFCLHHLDKIPQPAPSVWTSCP